VSLEKENQGMNENTEPASDMRVVLIESPYAGDVDKNIKYARACMRDSLDRGEAPLAMHLLYTQTGILNDAVPEERDWGIAAGMAWGKYAEITAVYSNLGITPGMEIGIQRAIQEARKIEYRELAGWSQ
jgi:hypothetical protein